MAAKVYFRDWAHLLNYLNETSKTPNQTSRHNQSHRIENYWQSDDSFTKTENFKQCLDLAGSGWLEPAPKVKALADTLVDKMTSLVERVDIRFDVEVGLALDYSRYATGDPECCIHLEHTLIEGQGQRVIRIGVSAMAPCSVDAKTIIQRGIRLMALIECLELGGFRVELSSVIPFSTSLRNEDPITIDIRVLLKAADQPIDQGRLLYAIGHPSMLRRVGFFVCERTAGVMEKLGSSYGLCADSPIEVKRDFDIYLAGLGSDRFDQWNKPGYTENWIIDNLKAQGVLVKE